MRFQIIRSLYPQKRGAFYVFIIIKLVFGGAYAIRPYMKPKKINAFSGNTVGAYFILPTKLPSKETTT